MVMEEEMLISYRLKLEYLEVIFIFKISENKMFINYFCDISLYLKILFIHNKFNLNAILNFSL